MSATDIFQPLCTQTKPPEQFYSPFNNQPHSLAVEAAEQLQNRLPVLTTATHDFQEVDGGKMLGVLVVQCRQRGVGYLSGFSGMLGGSWLLDGFVPPLFAHEKFQHMLNEGQQQLDSIERERVSIAENDNYLQAIADLQSTTAATSQALQEMKLQNAQNKQRRRVQRMENAGKPEVIRQLDEQSRTEKRLRQQHKREAEAVLETKRLAVEPYDVSLQNLSVRRRQLSARLQRQLFDEYVIRSIAAESVLLRSLFTDKLPPGGAGDCAAVKLLNAAIQQSLVPVCIAEFWWGANSGLRQHGRFYPSCRSKCRVILPHMLQGLDVAAPRYETIGGFGVDEPAVVYEDDYLVVVNKPAGMLSVPGHAISDCVETRLRKKYPQTNNSTLLLHRLDQATSGLLVAAKDATSYKNLQRQFEKEQYTKDTSHG